MDEVRGSHWEAVCGFTVLGIIFAGEVALILDSLHVTTIPLPDAAQIVKLIFFGH